ncbi:MAG: hypothetical protein WEB02_12265 [Methylophaga sp.]
MTKILFSNLAIALTFLAFVPYILQIFKGKVRPHVISWLIWGISTTVIFIAQLLDGAGVGAWPIGVSAALTLSVALLAFVHRADTKTDGKDMLTLSVSLLAIPVWYLTAEPLYAVIILTLVDLSGFIPTLRKINRDPYSELVIFFALFAVRNLLVLLALEHYSAVTILFPAAIGLACLAIMANMFIRRNRLVAS